MENEKPEDLTSKENQDNSPTPLSFLSEQPPAEENKQEEVSVFEEAKQSVIAEYKPQLDELTKQNQTLLSTIEQYKQLLKGTQRSESGTTESEPIKLKTFGASWHKKG